MFREGIWCLIGKASELHTKVEAKLLYLDILYPVADVEKEQKDEEEEEETRGEC